MLNQLLSIGTQKTNYSVASSTGGFLISHFKNILSQLSFMPHRRQKEYTDNRYKYGTLDQVPILTNATKRFPVVNANLRRHF